METMTVKTPGITCAHCQKAISQAVTSLPGAGAVGVDLETKLVTVSFDPARLAPEAIRQAIESQGYDIE